MDSFTAEKRVDGKYDIVTYRTMVSKKGEDVDVEVFREATDLDSLLKLQKSYQNSVDEIQTQIDAIKAIDNGDKQ